MSDSRSSCLVALPRCIACSCFTLFSGRAEVSRVFLHPLLCSLTWHSPLNIGAKSHPYLWPLCPSSNGCWQYYLGRVSSLGAHSLLRTLERLLVFPPQIQLPHNRHSGPSKLQITSPGLVSVVLSPDIAGTVHTPCCACAPALKAKSLSAPAHALPLASVGFTRLLAPLPVLELFPTRAASLPPSAPLPLSPVPFFRGPSC